MTTYKRTLLFLFMAFLALSCVNAPFPRNLVLQHLPTSLAIVALFTSQKLKTLSRFSFTLILIYLSFHVIGARYIYSYTPYDDWSKSILGFSINKTFGWERNNYDRIVHFAFGLFILIPFRELLLRYTNASRSFANYVSFEFILATALFNEVFEWVVSVVFSSSISDAYVAAQGDLWDSPKDMACQALGGLVAISLVLIYQRSIRKRDSIRLLP